MLYYREASEQETKRMESSKCEQDSPALASDLGIHGQRSMKRSWHIDLHWDQQVSKHSGSELMIALASQKPAKSISNGYHQTAVMVSVSHENGIIINDLNMI